MKRFLPERLPGHFLVAQRAEHYTHLTRPDCALRLVIARQVPRWPCQNGYQISTAFLGPQRIALDIDLYRHPDQPDEFEFTYQGRFYGLSMNGFTARIEPLLTSPLRI